MKAKEFGSWASSKMSPGGLRKSGDEFNKSLKGQSYRRYKEYASSDMEEYHKYPQIKDLTTEEEEKKNSQEQKSSESKNKQSDKVRQQSTSQIKKNLVSRFVAITAGTVVLVNTNPVLAERFPALQVSNIMEAVTGQTTSGEPVHNTPAEPDQPDEEPGALAANWTWSEDHESATLELVDGEGKVIASIPAAVDVNEEEAATCTVEGKKTYTASASSDGTSYSDSYEEIVEPLGHTLDEGHATVLDNGQNAILFECKTCHEQFIISTTIEEID